APPICRSRRTACRSSASSFVRISSIWAPPFYRLERPFDATAMPRGFGGTGPSLTYGEDGTLTIRGSRRDSGGRVKAPDLGRQGVNSWTFGRDRSPRRPAAEPVRRARRTGRRPPAGA